ncbi:MULTISPECIES: gamma carbonic anhydrase family protein [Zymobacter]|uniref:Anhydrase, family 3 protein n=1 Tax=Zymobacter palmae TaxID=33074 RepID=A0A348HIB9_9GAMM|nr:gamma carbonic anhydrase family protein [Zymobacter palmae]BBG31371.1 anhydrase, family 3 protein [Zymobacter palmae]
MGIRTYRGMTPTLGARVYVDPDSVVLGDVTLGDDVSIWPKAVLRGDVNGIRIGARSNVQDGVVLHTTYDGPFTPQGFPVTIGEEVTIGHSAVIHACTIHDRVLIGMGAIVLDGSVVQTNVIVAAGAVVPPGKVLESGYVYAGNPARPLRPLREQEYEFLPYSADCYVTLKETFLADSE